MDITAPMQGTIVTIDVVVGQQVRAGQQVMLIESMKMHHAIESASDGSIEALVVAVGATVMEHAVVARLAPGEVSIAAAATETAKTRRTFVPTWQRWSPATRSGSTRLGQRQSGSVALLVVAPLVRTSPTWWTMARSSNTALSSSRRNGAGEHSTT